MNIIFINIILIITFSKYILNDSQIIKKHNSNIYFFNSMIGILIKCIAIRKIHIQLCQ